MTRPDTQLLGRRRLLQGLGASVAVTGLAGCSSDGGGDDETEAGGDTDSTEETEAGGDTDSTEETETGGEDEATPGSDDMVTGSVTQNSIDGIEVTELQTEIDDDSIKAYVTFENTGGQTIPYRRPAPYRWEMSAFDADGNLLNEDPEPGVFWWETSEDIPPGETGGINLKLTLFDESSQAATVEISIACAENKDNTYC